MSDATATIAAALIAAAGGFVVAWLTLWWPQRGGRRQRQLDELYRRRADELDELLRAQYELRIASAEADAENWHREWEKERDRVR